MNAKGAERWLKIMIETLDESEQYIEIVDIPPEKNLHFVNKSILSIILKNN